MTEESSRRRNAKINISIALLYQLVSAIVGLILPRYILQTFGSDVNGIMQSISQLLSYTVVLECGIGGLVIASFYKPLANKDNEAISDIFNNTKTFFKKISIIFLGMLTGLILCSKIFIKTDYDSIYVGALALILGINYYFNYYFGITHQLLIKADQKIYIVQTIQIITTVLNAVVCIAAMKMGAGIHAVKLISAFVFLLNPVVYRIYVKKHYKISKKIYDPNRTFPKKKDGVVHHISYFIHRNTDIVLLSIFRGVKEVSVYSVYYSIVFAIENLLNAISTGLSGAIGNIIAKKEKKLLWDSFQIYEAFNTIITSFFYTVVAILIVPFIQIYTKGVYDIEYSRPLFAYLLVLSQWFYCVRIPYGNVLNAAGHYKQTKPGAYMEAALNLGVSLITVKKYGLNGVMFGSMVAMFARTIYTIWYLSKNILNRKVARFLKEAGLNFLLGILIVFFAPFIYTISTDSFFAWGIDAAVVCVVVFAVFIGLNFIIYNDLFISLLKTIRKK